MIKTDANLVEDYLQGEPSALDVLIKKYLKLIYNFVYRLIGDVDLAHDITQDVFVKVWQKLKQYDSKKSFKTWLFTIARNTIIDFARKKKLLSFSELEAHGFDSNNFTEQVVATDPQPDKIFEKLDTKNKMEAVIQQLPVIYRQVILLYYVQEFSLEEIAQILKKSVNTVKSQHRRALILLRQLADAPNFNLKTYL